MAKFGRSLFFDGRLSASGTQSCASCHDPANHYAPSNSLAVQPGGAHGERSGLRAVPTLTYLDEVPAFSTELENPDGSASAPGGGFDWDGRARSFAEQAGLPLLSEYEMANRDEAAVVAKLRANPFHRRALVSVFGAGILNDTHRSFLAAGTALQAFQHEDPSFHSYTSQYDYYVRGLATLTPQEARGQAVFNNADRGNCAACHTAGEGPGPDGENSSAQFTDFFFRNLGTPRNHAIDYGAHGSYDLGLCGPLRTDLTPQKNTSNRRFCGLFMTPTLRNVATRHVFFHNGAFRSLRDVIEFYLTRDITPQRWYPRTMDRLPYDDLPPSLRGQVDHDDMPFAAQHPGAQPVISEQDVSDLIAFLRTLTDGYVLATSPATIKAVSRGYGLDGVADGR